jgi:hypothetical protein
MSVRSRDKILANLEKIYREAYARAKKAEDEARMMDLDSSFQREQLILEVLLDVRDALYVSNEGSSTDSALKKLETFKKITRLTR